MRFCIQGMFFSKENLLKTEYQKQVNKFLKRLKRLKKL